MRQAGLKAHDQQDFVVALRRKFDEFEAFSEVEEGLVTTIKYHKYMFKPVGQRSLSITRLTEQGFLTAGRLNKEHSQLLAKVMLAIINGEIDNECNPIKAKNNAIIQEL